MHVPLSQEGWNQAKVSNEICLRFRMGVGIGRLVVTSHTGPANLPIINGVRRQFLLLASHINPAI